MNLMTKAHTKRALRYSPKMGIEVAPTHLCKREEKRVKCPHMNKRLQNQKKNAIYKTKNKSICCICSLRDMVLNLNPYFNIERKKYKNENNA